MTEQSKLVLIDGNSLAYRAFFANLEIRASDGTPTGAVFGFLRMLYRLLEEEKPQHVVVAFDTPGGTFREDLFAAYKGTRSPTPEDFKPQLPLLREVLTALNIHYIGLARYEADDIIGTLARLAQEQGVHTLIVSGDQDVMQLVDDNTTVLFTRKGVTMLERLDAAGVKEAYGVAPGQITDLKGLMGDSSDNIPGVPGVGQKTARKLLGEFGTMEAVLANANAVSGPKLRQSLTDYAGDAVLSKRLATIDRHIPVELDLAACAWGDPDWPRAQALFRRLEFKSLLPKVMPAVGAADNLGTAASPGADVALNTAGPDPADIQVIDTLQAARSLAGRLPGTMAALVPTAAVAAGEAVPPSGRWQPRGAAFSAGPGALVRYVSPEAMAGLDGYWPIAGDLTGFDLKPFLAWLYRRGVGPLSPVFDVKVAAYLLDPGRGSYELENLARTYGIGELPAGDDAAAMAAGAAALKQLRRELSTAMESAGLSKLFHEVEMPLLPVLAQMEAVGIAVDKGMLELMGLELGRRIEQISAEIFAAVDYRFNLNSPKQLADVLFGKLGLPVIKRTKTGPSTDAEVLEELASQAPVVARVLEYRTLMKLKGTYVDGLGPLVETDGRIHTTLHQTVTATGRLSSSDPNLQNIPIRIEEGRRLRKVFVPSRPDHVLMAADYSQVELRVVAHYSGDAGLTEAFHLEQDIHTRTAAEVFGVPMAEVTADMRRGAKSVNFGLIYGQGEFGLARALGIGRFEARKFIERYFERYPGVRKYMDGKVAEARELGYVTTLLGRRRPLPEIHARTQAVRQNAERAAINTPIQGTAADLMKLAMLAVQRAIAVAGLKSQMILQVHDELVFDVPATEVRPLNELVHREMEAAMALAVPLRVDVRVGSNWYDLLPVNRWLAMQKVTGGGL